MEALNHSTIFRHDLWRASEDMGQVSVACRIELRTFELSRRPLTLSGSHAAAASTKHIAKVTETVNIVQLTIAHLHYFERPSIYGSYTSVPATAGH